MNPAFERYIGIDYSGAATPKSSLKSLRVYAADRLIAPQEVEPPPSPRKYWTRRGIAESLVERLSEGQPTLVGIDYLGAQTPKSSLKGLRVYEADRLTAPQEVMPPPNPRKYWTRRGIAEWLVERLSESSPRLVGIDHGFSFPLRYFEQHGLPLDWPSFLDDFQAHWPTDEDIYVDFVRDGGSGNGAARLGNSRWRRLTEQRVRAKSVFHFDVQGSVAKSTHAGIPWLRYIRQHTTGRVHFWPFDGWDPPPVRSVIAEVYPALWNRTFPTAGRTPDQQDAFATAEWLRRADGDGSLEKFLCPELGPHERKTAEIEGWILGVV